MKMDKCSYAVTVALRLRCRCTLCRDHKFNVVCY